MSAADDATPEMPSLCRLRSVTVLVNLLCHKRDASEYLLIETVYVCFFYVFFLLYVKVLNKCSLLKLEDCLDIHYTIQTLSMFVWWDAISLYLYA